MEGLRSSSTPLVLFPVFLIVTIIILSFPSVYQENLSAIFPSFPTNQTPSVSPSVNVATYIKKVSRDEAELADARAAIREAIQTRNYTSDKEETIESHRMMKWFKICFYREGKIPLVHMGPMKHIYAIEGQFISEIESEKSHFFARHPYEAHAFFLPVSVAYIMKYVYMPITTYNHERLVRILTDYIKLWPTSTSFGTEHMAPDVSVPDPELYKNLIRVLCNANSSEGFHPERGVSLPELNLPPQGFSRSPDKRTILAFFAGGGHGDVRKSLLYHWKDKDDEVQVHGCLSKGQDYNKLMGKSKFCWCPNSYVLPFSDVLDWSKFSVEIPVERMSDIKRILKGIPEKKYRRMQKKVLKVRRHFELNRPAKPFDLLHMHNIEQQEADLDDRQHPNLVTIGEEIVRKCKEIPLAVRTLGSLLFLRTDESEWVSVRDSELCTLDQVVGQHARLDGA
ncbi:Exostosin family protein [Hibiscus syriacus]|uniref:Exostosin family protein n=1 Tax=Hibiscus syriacus TaxID=106335 RepID=A0A6A2XJS4_HIBSY|nr:Exostosin family protein [Hibiscus syriacus]